MKEYIFEAIHNFRDLGGYPTEDGRHIRYGQFYRCAGLDEATDADIKALEILGIKHDLDLRSSRDFASRPDRIPCGVQLHEIPARLENEYTSAHTLNFFELLQSDMKPEEVKECNRFLYEVYGFIAFDNPALRLLFSLVEQEETPLLFHCAGGKDRTGVSAILIMKLLGVDDETILHDYLRSNKHIGENGYINYMIRLKGITDPQIVEKVWETCGVNEEFFQIFYRSIKERYGDFDTYFLKEFGIDADKKQKLRALYLE